MQRTDLLATREPSVGFVRKRKTLLVVELRYYRVDFRIEAINLAQKCAHDFAR